MARAGSAATSRRRSSGLTLLNTTYDGYTTANPISNADMWNAVGGTVGNNTSTFDEASIVAVAGRGKVINHHFTAGEYIDTGDGMSMWVPLSQSVDEATMSYDMRWLSGSSYGWGGKLPGLCGIAPGHGNPPSGGSPSIYGWSARSMWLAPTAGGNRSPAEWIGYVYDPLQAGGSYGQNRHTSVGFGGAGGIPDGTWVNVKQYHRMNDVSVDGSSWSANGIHRMWFDGVLVYEKLNQVYREYTAGRVTHIDYSVYYGGGTVDWAPTSNSDLQFDNMLITSP
jgi:hypothetical protein